MNIGSIFVALGFKANTKDLNSFNAGIKSLRSNLVITTAAFTGATYALKKFIDSGAVGAANLVNFNRQTGLSIDRLNQFAQAGQSLSSALNVENVTNDIANLEKTLARIRLGQASVKPFQMLGINVHGQNAFGVLDQLRNNIKGLSNSTASVLLEDLGLNPHFLQVLKLSNGEFQKLGQNNFLQSGQAKTINQLGLNVRNLTTAFTNLKNQALAKLAPSFNDLINKSLKWLNANSSQIIKAIADMAKWVGIFATGIGRAVSFLSDFVGRIAGVENGLKILAAGFALITLSFSPFLLGLTAILLLLDDIAVWKMGGKSLFGDFYNAVSKIPNIEKILGIGGAVAGVALLTGGLGKMLGVIMALGKKLAIVAGAFYAIREMGKWLEDFFGGKLGEVLKSSANILGGAAAGGLLAGPAGAVVGAGGAAINEILDRETIDFWKNKFGFGGASSSTANNNINLTINTMATDALDVADAVKDALTDLLKPAVNSLGFEI